jgi:peptidoglycan/LPS O-acetylase OafA/YrhL
VTAVSFYYIVIKGQTELLEKLPFYYIFLANFLKVDIPLLSPTWSLSVEEQYYMVWPLLLLLIPRRFIVTVLIALIALNVVAVTGGLRVIGVSPIEVGPLVIKMFTATYAPILIGSALAVFLNKKAGFAVLKRVLGYKSAAPASFGLLLVFMAVLPNDVAGWPNLVLHLTMASCLASIVMREDHLLHRAFRWWPIVRVGEISYGIYLYHLIGLFVANSILSKIGWQGDWYTFVVYSLVSIGMAELSFRYYETPFLNLRHRVPSSGT